MVVILTFLVCPCIYDYGMKGDEYEFDFCICESLELNVMKYFSTESRCVPECIILSHIPRMVFS